MCQGKGQRSQRAKNRRKHFLRKINQANSNLVAILVSGLWARAGKNGTVFFTTIGRHLECAIQTEPVVELELALIERKQSRRFRHNSIRYERVRVGWHCAKVKGHAELVLSSKLLCIEFTFMFTLHIRKP